MRSDTFTLAIGLDWLEHLRSKRVLKRVVIDSIDWVNVIALRG